MGDHRIGDIPPTGAGPRIAVNTAEHNPQVVAVDNAQQQQQQQQQQPNNQFGAVRDRLFHAMLVRMALSYSRHVPRTARRLIECFCLLIAMSLLCLMLYVHLMFGKTGNTCLSHLSDKWPRDGVLRVEVISNLDKFNAFQQRLNEETERRKMENSSHVTHFNLRRVLVEGPKALPRELRSKNKQSHRRKSQDHWSSFLSADDTLFNLFLKPEKGTKKRFNNEEFIRDDDQSLAVLLDEDDDFIDLVDDSDATFEYVVEYALHYGLLRLPHSYRLDHNIPFLLVRLDPEKDSCFGDWFSKGMMKYLIGYEDVLMASVKALAENETDKGYLRDMITGEHYRFVTMGNSKASYFTAMFVMLIFTFAISMLLRFSHHQIFLFIVDLLQMFELNQALVFPAAPLLTVILALVGMEAIMSEVFNDTSTAFYVILLVWIADQYDAICCHSPISKRHWLRFFYLYHYAFYAYQYRYNGQYGGLALLTSIFFILHSMIFFFHHYEMPLILYQERLQRIISDLQHNPPQQPGTMNNAEVGDGEIRSVVTPRATVNEQSANATITIRSASESNFSAASGGAVASRNSINTFSVGRSEGMQQINNRQAQNEMNASRVEHESGASVPSTNVVVDDPLLAAGERTAHEIMEIAMSGLFQS